MENSIEERLVNNLTKLYELNGNNKDIWKFIRSIVKRGKLNDIVINYIKTKVLEEPNNELNLDLMDYIVDLGYETMNNIIFDQDLLVIFVNKTIINNENNQKILDLSLYLMQKWVDRFNEKYETLIELYREFKNEGRIFTTDKKDTYEKYITLEEINDANEEDNIFNDEKEVQYNPIENPFDENLDNLYENVDFPEEEIYDNKFSNLRTSDIPTYFRCLRNKSIIENPLNQKKNEKENDSQPNIDIIDETNEEYKNNGNNNKTEEEKQKELNQKKNSNSDNKNNWSTTFQKYRKDPLLFENQWKETLSKLNQWIKEGKNSTNYENLKEGIRQILIGYDEIEEIIMTCIKIEDNDGRNTVSYIKSDIEQTCYRFECLKQGKKVEKFKSAFDGNVTKYYFYQPTLLEEDDNDGNININNINVIESPKKEKKIKSIGRAIKNGFLNLGKRNSNNTKSKEQNKDKELGNLGALHMDE